MRANRAAPHLNGHPAGDCNREPLAVVRSEGARGPGRRVLLDVKAVAGPRVRASRRRKDIASAAKPPHTSQISGTTVYPQFSACLYFASRGMPARGPGRVAPPFGGAAVGGTLTEDLGT